MKNSNEECMGWRAIFKARGDYSEMIFWGHLDHSGVALSLEKASTGQASYVKQPLGLCKH